MLVTLKKQIPEKDRIYSHLGNSRARSRSKSIRVKIKKITETLPDYIEPRLVYSKWRVDTGTDCIKFENGLELRSRKFAMIMRHATEAYCFVATIGSRIDRKIKKLMKDNKLSDAYLLDTAGSFAIEDAVEQFCNEIHKEAEQKAMTTTIRFSPGYCDCSVSEQRKLFRLVTAEKIGVSLTDACLMQPRKTISGIFGIVPPQNIKHYSAYIPCRDCSRQKCMSRREEYQSKSI